NLGDFARYQGHLDEARARYEESLALQRSVGDTWGMALSLAELGMVARDEGNYPLASEFALASLTLLREQRIPYFVPEGLDLLAAAASAQGRAKRAARLLGAAEALREALGAPLPPPDREPYDRHLTRVRSMLDAGAFAASWAAGRSLEAGAAVE